MGGLTRKRLRAVLHYDPLTGAFTWIKSGRIAGHVSKRSGHRSIKLNGRPYQASNLAWLYVKGRWPTRIVDHENREAGDDRFVNLRLATKRQNMHNSKPRRDGTGLKGVGPQRGRFRSRITVNGVQLFLGNFATAAQASAAYRSAARKHFRTYAAKEQPC